MEAFNCHSYLRRCHSDSRPETPSQSESSTRQVFSDEEVFINVASKNPKRRAGRKKFRETRHPVYRGVRQRNNGKWVCEVREPNKKSRIWLGTFPSPEMAARAHDVAAMALRGRSACLNFADSVWLLPVPVSAEAKEIQKTAAEAAEAFRPSLQSDVESAGEDANQTNLSPSPMDEEAAEAYRNSSQSDAASAGEDRNLTNLPPLLGNASYMDEEAVLDMPKLLADMAQGLLLSPQSCGSRFHWDDVDTAADVSLWSYSI